MYDILKRSTRVHKIILDGCSAYIKFLELREYQWLLPESAQGDENCEFSDGVLRNCERFEAGYLVRLTKAQTESTARRKILLTNFSYTFQQAVGPKSNNVIASNLGVVR